jgi:hypothetical protein
MDPEDEWVDSKFDDLHIAATGQMDPSLYDFVDYTLMNDGHENYDDVVEQKIFKYKYRQFADNYETYNRRQVRMRSRMLERAKTRDPALEQEISGILTVDQRDNSFATLATNPDQHRDVATEETRLFREYMVNESTQ